MDAYTVRSRADFNQRSKETKMSVYHNETTVLTVDRDVVNLLLNMLDVVDDDETLETLGFTSDTRERALKQLKR